MECKLEVRPSLIVETPSECRRQHVPDKHTLSMHKTQELLKKFYRKFSWRGKAYFSKQVICISVRAVQSRHATAYFSKPAICIKVFEK